MSDLTPGWSVRAIAGLWSGIQTSGPPLAQAECASLLRVASPLPPILLQPAPGLVFGEVEYEACIRAPGEDTPGPHPGQDPPFVADLRLNDVAALRRRLDLRPGVSHRQIFAAAWRKWRFGIVDEIIGEFAFAVWDEPSKTLFLARDHAGARPLHIAPRLGPQGGFAFASMPPSLYDLVPGGARIDRDEMARYLAILTVSPMRSLFKGIETVPPAHWVKVSAGGMEVRRYWHAISVPPIRYRRDEEYIEDFCERFDRAVGDCLPPSGIVATQLSGGLDSASVTVTASRLLSRTHRLISFTAIPSPEWDGAAPPGRFANEGPAAAEVAALCTNLEHVFVDNAGSGDLIAAFRRDTQLTGLPTIAPTHLLWLGAILQQARGRGASVLLYGAGGNSTISFGGILGLSPLFRSLRWGRLYRLTRTLRANGYTSWRGAASMATAGLIPEWLRRHYHPAMRRFSFDYTPINPAVLKEFNLRNLVLHDFFSVEANVENFRRKAYEYYDPGPLTAYAAVAWGIEQRDPTLDKRVLEFCYGIPIDQYLVGGQTRSVIRRAMKGRLPESTLRRSIRGLQAADWPLTVRAALPALASELDRIEGSPLAVDLLDTRRLRHLIQTFPTSGFDNVRHYESYHVALMRGIAAGSFLADHDPAARKQTQKSSA